MKLRFAAEGCRIDPVSGTAFEFRNIYSDSPKPDTTGLSPVYNGKRIHLRCSRNEWVSFQIIVDRAQDSVLHNLKINITDIAQKDGGFVLKRGKQVQLFRQWYLPVKNPSEQKRLKLFKSLGAGWYPDPLIPLDNTALSPKFGFPMTVPSPENRIGSSQRCQGFWVDIFVPADARPGRYMGHVTAEAQEESSIRTPLDLEVLPFALADSSHMNLSGSAYMGINKWARYNPQFVQNCFRVAKAHRMNFEPIGPEPEVAGGKIVWNAADSGKFNYDKWMGPLLTGALFSEDAGYVGPGAGVPLQRITLPFRLHAGKGNPDEGFPDAKFDLPTDNGAPLPNEAYVKQFAAYAKEFEKHFRKMDWARTEQVVFMNDFLDEPCSRNVWEKGGKKLGGFSYTRWFGNLVHRSFSGKSRVLVRSDLGVFANCGMCVKGWTADSLLREIGDAVDILNINGYPSAFDTKKLREYARKKEKRVDFYYSCTAGEPAVPPSLLDTESHGFTLWSWICWKYGLDGAIPWNIYVSPWVHGSTAVGGWETAGECTADPKDECAGCRAGEGVLYTGAYIGLPSEPISSIRMKAMRRGVQDYEYLWLLKEKDGKAHRADSAASLIIHRALDEGWTPGDKWMGQPGAWEHDPEAVGKVRDGIADILSTGMIY